MAFIFHSGFPEQHKANKEQEYDVINSSSCLQIFRHAITNMECRRKFPGLKNFEGGKPPLKKWID